MSKKYQSVLIYLELICLAYIAGLFLTYSFIVMPGLSIIDDKSFVAAFQGLESRFAFESSGYANIPAMIAFPGALIFGISAAIANRKTAYVRWLILAFVLFFTGMISTVIINLPANEAIYTAGDPDIIDVAQVRMDFNEVQWLNWNHFRTLTTCLAIACLIRSINLIHSI